MRFGNGNFIYESDITWGLEDKIKWNIKVVAGITVDEEDNVYVLSRSQPPVIVFDKNGKVIETFGDNIFGRAHGMFRDFDGSLFGVDDALHCVYKFDQSRNISMTLGTKNIPSAANCCFIDGKEVISGAVGPFNRPTRLVTDKNGYIYVTDGYGNARVHKFDKLGNLILSWGEPGPNPGQFNLPHGIGIDKDNILYVADRQNNRVQRFTNEGILIDVWKDFHRPSDIWVDDNNTIFVAECRRITRFNTEPSRITILDNEGNILSRLGNKDIPYDEALGFRSAHGLAVDSEGSIYVGNVGLRWPSEYSGLQKYRRV